MHNYGSPGHIVAVIAGFAGAALVLTALIGRGGSSRTIGIGAVTALTLFLGIIVMIALSGHSSFDPVGHFIHPH